MRKINYVCPEGSFSIFFNEKLLKVVGHERENDQLRERLVTLEAYTFVSFAQYKATIARIMNSKQID